MRGFLTISLVFVFCFNEITAQDSIIEHKIQKGETAYFIAQKYKVSVDEIYKLNPESQNGIKDNQIIKIPVHSLQKINQDEHTIHIVGEKETLYGLSKKYNVSVEALQNANPMLVNGLQIGQQLVIPPNASNTSKTEISISSKLTHQVVAKESLFSIARQYNVSVQDLENLNKNILINGLQIGQTISIPNKRKTLDGRVRVINQETVFHVVEPKETKFSIAKRYGVSIDQLETQNPEIVNGLVVGNKLAINTTAIKPANESEELMMALAEKQVVVEKTKAKTVEIDDLKDRLIVQKEMNQKIIKINDLKMNLNDLNGSKENSVEKLRLVLEANKNVQDILMAKLDSLVNTMNNDLLELKRMDILNIDESKRLEKLSYESIGKTNELSSGLKNELAENRKAYADLMNKVEKITVEENQEYKKKIRESEKKNNTTSIQQRLSLEEIKRYKIDQEQGDAKNQLLIAKIDSLDIQKKIEVKRHISKASYYSMEARKFDDKLALVKLKKYQDEAVKKSNGTETSKIVSLEEMKKELKENPFKNEKNIKIEVFDNLKEVLNGYYLVLGTFTDAVPRDQFIMKLIDSGDFNASFFFNINSLSYYVYSDKYNNMEEVLYQCKKKEEDELYKKIIIAKAEIDLR
ncbi:LysM peptidoglycan-binding domain-containing protein [Flavobacterium sp. RS13.1]|uniref:lytic transglycosylase n=1 Tax=Flavobacterium sp. RS13.1 TaxID=3400345 RepID=UPI003AAD409C